MTDSTVSKRRELGSAEGPQISALQSLTAQAEAARGMDAPYLDPQLAFRGLVEAKTKENGGA